MSAQKALSEMLVTYESAISLLKCNKVEEGVSILQQIRRSKLINDPDLRNLKHTTMMSLGEVYEYTSNLTAALHCYHQALTPASTFTIYLKMRTIAHKLNLPQLEIVFVKRALEFTPEMWRNRLLDQLRGLYTQCGRTDAVRDLDCVRRNPRCVLHTPSLDRHLSSVEEDRSKHMPVIRIMLNHQTVHKVGMPEIALGIAYVLVKAQMDRNFNKRKQVTKNEPIWREFLANYHPLYTQVVLSVKKTQTKEQMDPIPEEESNNEVQDQSQMEANQQSILSSILSQLALLVLKNHKKKKPCPKQPYKKPHLNSLTVGQYFRQCLTKHNLSVEKVLFLSEWNPQLYEQLFQSLLCESKVQTKTIEQSLEGYGKRDQKEWVPENSYSNVYKLIQDSCGKWSSWQCRCIGMKCITKVLSNVEITSQSIKGLLPHMVQWLEYLVSKKYKNQESFKNRCNKIKCLSAYIDKHYFVGIRDAIQYKNSLTNTTNSTNNNLTLKTVCVLLFKKNTLCMCYDQSKVRHYIQIGKVLGMDLTSFLQCLTKRNVRIEKQILQSRQFQAKSNEKKDAKLPPSQPIIYSLLQQFEPNYHLQPDCSQSINYIRGLCELLTVYHKYLQKGRDEAIEVGSNLKQICRLYEQMQIERVVRELYERVELGTCKLRDVPRSLVQRMFYLLLRLHLFSAQRAIKMSDHSFRLLFVVSTLLKMGPRPFALISLLSDFIQMEREDPQRNITIVCRKYFENVIVRNIDCFLEADIEGIEKINQVLTTIFTQFTPKSKAEAFAYLYFLARCNHSVFACAKVDFNAQIKRAVEKCIGSYLPTQQIVGCCKKFNTVKMCFITLLQRKKQQFVFGYNYMQQTEHVQTIQNEKEIEEVVEAVLNGKYICDCCGDYWEIPLVIGKYYQASKENTPETYFIEYLLLVLNMQNRYKINGKSFDAWGQLLRTYCTQSWMWFDDSCKQHKNKYLYAYNILKIINTFINKQCQECTIAGKTRKQQYKKQYPNFLAIGTVLNAVISRQQQLNAKIQFIKLGTYNKDSYTYSYQCKEQIQQMIKDNRLKIAYILFTEKMLSHTRMNTINTIVSQTVNIGIMLLQKIMKDKEENVAYLEEDIAVALYILITQMMESSLEGVLKKKLIKVEEFVENINFGVELLLKVSEVVNQKYKLKVKNVMQNIDNKINKQINVVEQNKQEKQEKYGSAFQNYIKDLNNIKNMINHNNVIFQRNEEQKNKIIEENIQINNEQIIQKQMLVQNNIKHNNEEEQINEQNIRQQLQEEQLNIQQQNNEQDDEGQSPEQLINQRNGILQQEGVKVVRPKMKSDKNYRIEMEHYLECQFAKVFPSESIPLQLQMSIRRLQATFTEVYRLLVVLQGALKRQKYRRSNTSSLLLMEKWVCVYNYDLPKAVEVVRKCCRQFVFGEVEECEKNEVLSDLYARQSYKLLIRINHLQQYIHSNIECSDKLIGLLKKIHKTANEESTHPKQRKVFALLYVYGLYHYTIQLRNKTVLSPLSAADVKRLAQMCGKIRKGVYFKESNWYEEKIKLFVAEYEQKYGCKIKVRWIKEEKNQERSRTLKKEKKKKSVEKQKKNTVVIEINIVNYKKNQVDLT